MQIEINVRGNGACPLCNSNEKCQVLNTFKKEMEFFSSKDDPMEIVIYSCPYFEEQSDE